jgi:hypothetical protein
MTNRVMRVRGSFGLKLASDDSEKGSALIDTDSSATARVEPADMLINVGLRLGAAEAGATAPHIIRDTTAHTVATKRLPEAKARFLIGVCSLCQKQYKRIDMRLAKRDKLGGGATGR